VISKKLITATAEASNFNRAAYHAQNQLRASRVDSDESALRLFISSSLSQLGEGLGQSGS
jgi:hypothetical protein